MTLASARQSGRTPHLSSQLTPKVMTALSLAATGLSWSDAAAEVGMIMPLETVLGSLIAWYVISEVPSVNALVGGSIVIVTLFLHSWYSTRLAKNQID